MRHLGFKSTDVESVIIESVPQQRSDLTAPAAARCRRSMGYYPRTGVIVFTHVAALLFLPLPPVDCGGGAIQAGSHTYALCRSPGDR